MNQRLEKLLEKTRQEYAGYQKLVHDKLNDPISVEYHIDGMAESATTIHTNVLGMLYLLLFTYGNPKLFNGWDNRFQDDLADINVKKPFIIPTEGMDWISEHITALREVFGASKPKVIRENVLKVHDLLVEEILSDFRANAGLMYDDERKDELLAQVCKVTNYDLLLGEARIIATDFLNGIGVRVL